METRGASVITSSTPQATSASPATTNGEKDASSVSKEPQATPTHQRQKLKQPGVSYRATLQKLSNTISLSSSEILERYEKSEPSLILHFHNNHWKFENQDGMFLYNSPARQILECIRHEQIPVDCLEVFRDVKVRYYEGCLILRLIDHRQDPPITMHTALRPSPESIWTEMLLYSEQTQGNFTDAKALQVESDILVATNPPLDLRPSPHPEYSMNLLSDMKDQPLPKLRRKRESLHVDDAEERMLYLYDERHGREFAPDFKRLAFVEAHRKKKQLQQQRAQANGAEAKAASAITPNLANGLARKSSISQSPSVAQHSLPPQSSPLAQQAAVAGGTGGQVPDRALPAHLQNRPSASPQPGPRQVLNQQALAQHLAQQNQALQNGSNAGSPRLPSQVSTNSPQVQALAHQQQIMLQQRAMAMRNINAVRAAQAQAAAQGQSPRTNGQGGGQLGVQGTPTPLQMQQIRQMQAQQQQQQLLAAQQQAAQNAQFQQMR